MQMLLHLQTLRSRRETAEAFPIHACMSLGIHITSPRHLTSKVLEFIHVLDVFLLSC